MSMLYLAIVAVPLDLNIVFLFYMSAADLSSCHVERLIICFLSRISFYANTAKL